MEKQTDLHRHPTDTINPRRPFALSIIFWVLLFWSLLGWFRFARTLIDQSLILDLLPVWRLWYLRLVGLIWGLAGLPVIWGILRRKASTLKLIWVIGFFYPLVYWIERLVLWASPENGSNWLFMLVLTLFWLGLVIWAAKSKRVKRFLNQEKNEDGSWIIKKEK